VSCFQISHLVFFKHAILQLEMHGEMTRMTPFTMTLCLGRGTHPIWYLNTCAIRTFATKHLVESSWIVVGQQHSDLGQDSGREGQNLRDP